MQQEALVGNSWGKIFLNLDLVWFISSEFRWGQGFHITCSALVKKLVSLRKGL